MKKTFTLLVSLLILTLNCFAQNVWTQKASYPVGVFLAIGFSIGDKGYIGTGDTYYSGNGDSFWEYDPSSDSWTQKANFAGGAMSGCYGFSIGTKGYVGVDSVFWEFDPSLNNWMRKTSIHAFAGNGFSIGTKGYVFGGDSSNYFWEYDPSLDSWTPKANPPLAALTTYPVTFSIGSKGYIATGLGVSSRGTTNLWEYDQLSDLWTQKASLPGVGRDGAVAFVIGSKGYVGTGQDSLTYLKDFWEYDTTSNAWTQIADYGGGGITEAVAFAIGNNGFVGTGAPKQPPPSNGFWEYSPLVGINNLSEINYCVSVYPNPFSEEAIIGINKFLKDATLAIYNAYGQQVKQMKNISGEKVILYRDNLASGFYLLQLTEDGKIIVTEKLIIVDN